MAGQGNTAQTDRQKIRKLTADRLNACHIPGQYAFLMTAGNMQHMPLHRLDPDDVYRDIQEVKEEAARWVAEKWEMIFPSLAE